MEGMTTSLLEPESANGNNCLAHVSNIPDDKPPMHVWNENTVVMRVFHALTRIGVSDRGLTSLKTELMISLAQIVLMTIH
jgi:hypothetical protein